MNQKVNYIRAALLGLTLAGAAGFNTAAQAQDIAGTNIIALTDFDVNVPGWDYGYQYSWPINIDDAAFRTTDRFYDDSANGGTLCMRYTFISAPSPYYDLYTTNSGGFGTGFGGPQAGWGWDPAIFNTLVIDPTNYLFEFDARVEGLTDGVTSGNIEMQCQVTGSGGSPMYLQKNYGVSVGSNWTHFAFTFDDGTFGGGSSWASFSNNLAIIAEVRFNVNLHEPYNQFGWDDYNVVLIDNMQLAVRQFSGVIPPTPPTVPLTILEWNMDDKPLTYTWGTFNWSADTNNPQIYIPTYTYSATTSEMAGYGVGGSNGWWLQMDNSTLAPPNTPAWAGGNTGGGGPVDLSRFTDNVLKSYVLECDVRVEGLAPDASVGVVDIPLSMDSPRGNVRLEFSFPGGSNWVHSAVDFSQANWNTGDGRLPKSSFATNYNTYTSIAIELQLNSAPNGAMWEFDANNRVVVDNIKLVHYVAACPPLTIFTATNNVIVTWDAPSTGTAILLSGDTVAGVTNEVGTTSPYVIPIASAPKYFRTRWVAP